MGHGMTFFQDDREWEWNGWCLVDSSGLFVIPLPSEPSPEETAKILRGWQAGYEAGKHTGRSILQNEFRNLMDCQPK
jgi:hypothetical protein